MLIPPPNSVHPKTRAGWRRWLQAHHTQTGGVWLIMFKTPAGLAKVEAAKRSGDWTSLDAFEVLEIPPDLGAALAASEGAQGYFDAFPRSVKFVILHWIASAKTPETRAKRIAESAASAAKN